MSVFQRIKNVFKSRRIEEELEEEIEFHLQARTEEYIAADGMTAREARERARREFGNVTALTERTRDSDLLTWLDIAWQDLRYSLRCFRRNRGFAVVAVASLCLGISSTAALFAVVDAVIWAPLGLQDSQELLRFRESRRGEELGGGPARLKNFQSAHSFAAVAGFYSEGATLQKREGSVRLRALRTFGPVGKTLGIRPVAGRGFTEREETGSELPVALISYAAWKKNFGGTNEVLGRTLRLGKDACTIIGVLPADARYPEGVDLWAPAPPVFQNLGREATFLEIVGRLAPGVTKEEATAEVRALDARLAKLYPATDAAIQTTLQPLKDAVVEGSRASLLTLFAAVGAVLLVACVNIAGLSLAQVWARRRESTLRVALGATTGRLVRLRLLEVWWLALAGGVSGVLLAKFFIRLLKAVLPQDLPRLGSVELSSHVLLFAGGLTILCALLAGLPPAWHEAQGALVQRLKEGSGGSLGAGRYSLRSALVTGQVALSMLLLVCACLLVHSLIRMRQVHLGFSPESTMAMTTAFNWDAPDQQIQHFTSRALERLAALPGVSQVGIVDRLPLNGGAESAAVMVRGRELDPDLSRQSVGLRAASAGYFRALRVPLLAGSFFPDHVDAESRNAVLVNEAFARRYFPKGDAPGQLVKTRPSASSADDKNWFRIRGVIGNIRTELRESSPSPEIYQMWEQKHWPLMAFVVRTSVNPGSFAATMRKALAEVDPDQPVSGPQPLTELVAEASASSRLQTTLLSSFAGAALLLAAIGLYGLLAGEVARRTPELGVRLALGAEPSALLRMELTRGMRMVAIGLLLGAGVAAGATRLLRSLLFEVGTNDFAAMVAATVVLTAVGIAACWFPSRRAAEVDPLIALRQE